MDQTPSHEQHNPDLLRLIPRDARRVVEVGVSSGALAREYKKINPTCHYVGVEIVSEYANLARRYCDEVHELDIELADEGFLRKSLEADCWIFGDVLEHIKDPWTLLARIRTVRTGCVVACIPNAQHWSMQTRLNSGLLRYEPHGLMDRTHLRWFTRITIIEMFSQASLKIVAMFPRVFREPGSDVMAAIEQMARCLGIDPEVAKRDALAFQYAIRAVPITP